MRKAKILIGLTFITFVLFSCAGDKTKNKKNHLTDLKLKGDVKSLTETIYDASEKFGEIQKGEKKYKYFSLFNEDGNKTDYSENNFPSLMSNFDKKYDFKYDDKGTIIEWNLYKSNGKLDRKEKYKIDDKGNKIEENWYDGDGSLKFKIIFKYDEKGNLIKTNWYNSHDSLKFKEAFKYDSKGNQIEYIEYKYAADSSLVIKQTFKYDDKNNQIEMNDCNIDGSINCKYTYKYDEKGNEIEKINYAPDGSITEKVNSEYAYDDKNNWIKKTEKSLLKIFGYESITYNITEREIVYY
ncbi:MAG TPA: hypothetical protein PKK00_13190 [Bacteroidales bacterium]|nr:hypothetical protein [Bacteroidales bacterium]